MGLESLNQFTWLDFLVLGVLTISTFMALIKGLLAELVSLASVVVGIFAAVSFYPQAAGLANQIGVGAPWGGFLGFISIFLLCMTGGALLIRISRPALKALHLQWVDRLLGGTFGLIRGCLIAVVLFTAFTLFPVSSALVERSQLAGFFLTSARVLTRLTPKEFQEQFSASYQAVYQEWIQPTRQENAADKANH